MSSLGNNPNRREELSQLRLIKFKDEENLKEITRITDICYALNENLIHLNEKNKLLKSELYFREEHFNQLENQFSSLSGNDDPSNNHFIKQFKNQYILDKLSIMLYKHIEEINPDLKKQTNDFDYNIYHNLIFNSILIVYIEYADDGFKKLYEHKQSFNISKETKFITLKNTASSYWDLENSNEMVICDEAEGIIYNEESYINMYLKNYSPMNNMFRLINIGIIKNRSKLLSIQEIRIADANRRVKSVHNNIGKNAGGGGGVYNTNYDPTDHKIKEFMNDYPLIKNYTSIPIDDKLNEELKHGDTIPKNFETSFWMIACLVLLYAFTLNFLYTSQNIEYSYLRNSEKYRELDNFESTNYTQIYKYIVEKIGYSLFNKDFSSIYLEQLNKENAAKQAKIDAAKQATIDDMNLAAMNSMGMMTMSTPTPTPIANNMTTPMTMPMPNNPTARKINRNKRILQNTANPNPMSMSTSTPMTTNSTTPIYLNLNYSEYMIKNITSILNFSSPQLTSYLKDTTNKTAYIEFKKSFNDHVIFLQKRKYQHIYVSSLRLILYKVKEKPCLNTVRYINNLHTTKDKCYYPMYNAQSINNIQINKSAIYSSNAYYNLPSFMDSSFIYSSDNSMKFSFEGTNGLYTQQGYQSNIPLSLIDSFDFSTLIYKLLPVFDSFSSPILNTANIPITKYTSNYYLVNHSTRAFIFMFTLYYPHDDIWQEVFLPIELSASGLHVTNKVYINNFHPNIYQTGNKLLYCDIIRLIIFLILIGERIYSIVNYIKEYKDNSSNPSNRNSNNSSFINTYSNLDFTISIIFNFKNLLLLLTFLVFFISLILKAGYLIHNTTKFADINGLTYINAQEVSFMYSSAMNIEAFLFFLLSLHILFFLRLNDHIKILYVTFMYSLNIYIIYVVYVIILFLFYAVIFYILFSRVDENFMGFGKSFMQVLLISIGYFNEDIINSHVPMGFILVLYLIMYFFLMHFTYSVYISTYSETMRVIVQKIGYPEDQGRNKWTLKNYTALFWYCQKKKKKKEG